MYLNTVPSTALYVCRCALKEDACLTSTSAKRQPLSQQQPLGAHLQPLRPNLQRQGPQQQHLRKNQMKIMKPHMILNGSVQNSHRPSFHLLLRPSFRFAQHSYQYFWSYCSLLFFILPFSTPEYNVPDTSTGIYQALINVFM